MKSPKIPKALIQKIIASPKILRSAFDPSKRERDMLAQAKEDGCYGAGTFQKEEPNDPSV